MDTVNSITKQTKKQSKRMFRQITYKDRLIIEVLLNSSLKKNYTGPKITCQFLANKLGFSKSTIARELKRGAFKELDGWGHYVTKYRSATSDARRKTTSKRSHYHTILTKGCHELKFISNQLHKGADVHTALFNYELLYGKSFPVCEKTIYNYYHKRMLKGIKPYRSNKTIHKTPKLVQKGKNISERPFTSDNREIFGHWEGDLIVGSKGSSQECLLTLIERKTRFYYAIKIPNKTMESVVHALNDLENKLSFNSFKTIFKSITFDNGTEFNDFKHMEFSNDNLHKRTDIYYANPYHSWERGSNERGNRMMRKFFPKGTDFSKVSESNIMDALCKINYTFRKILNNHTAMDIIKNLENEIPSIFEKFNLKNKFLCN